MRALTLHRPWPWAIFHLPPGEAKRVENRSWKPPKWLIGEPIAIHAGRAYDPDGEDFIEFDLNVDTDDARRLHMGLIGTAIVVGFTFNRSLVDGRWPSTEREATVDRWLFGPYGWLLDEVRPFKRPLTCSGMQGLWRVPDDTIRQFEFA